VALKIERVELFHISQPLVSPFVTSFGPQQQRDCLILATYAEGVTGWGECVATNDPGYSYETVQTAWHILADFLIPALRDWSFAEPEELPGRLTFVRGHPLAKAALEQALWDLTAQRDGLSMAAKLAQPYPERPRRRVKVGVSIGLQPTIEETITVIGDYVAQGTAGLSSKSSRAVTSIWPRPPGPLFPTCPSCSMPTPPTGWLTPPFSRLWTN
jgi:o-succinylbenzoate synthase